MKSRKFVPRTNYLYGPSRGLLRILPSEDKNSWIRIGAMESQENAKIRLHLVDSRLREVRHEFHANPNCARIDSAKPDSYGARIHMRINAQ